MAKSILIQDAYGTLSLFTEGVNDCVQITPKLYYANGAMVIITFHSLPTLTYYNCKFLISENLTINPNNNYIQLYKSYTHFTAAMIKTDGDTLVIPTPPSGMKILIQNSYIYFNYGTVAYTNSGSGGMYLKHGSGIGGTAIFAFTQFKLTVKSQTSLLISSTYVNQNYADTLPVYLNINCTNATGDSTMDVNLFYYLIPV
jgi:hypothetical protein